jgi:hypothetical protein
VNDQEIVDRADLQVFTKDELIEYILAVSFMLRRHPPARTILEFRAEKIHKKIDKNLRETDDLIAAAKDKRITAGEFSERHFKLQSQWTRLNNELRGIENKLYTR